MHAEQGRGRRKACRQRRQRRWTPGRHGEWMGTSRDFDRSPRWTSCVNVSFSACFFPPSALRGAACIFCCRTQTGDRWSRNPRLVWFGELRVRLARREEALSRLQRIRIVSFVGTFTRQKWPLPSFHASMRGASSPSSSSPDSTSTKPCRFWRGTSTCFSNSASIFQPTLGWCLASIISRGQFTRRALCLKPMSARSHTMWSVAPPGAEDTSTELINNYSTNIQIA